MAKLRRGTYRKMLGNGLLARSTVCWDPTHVSDRICLNRFAGIRVNTRGC